MDVLQICSGKRSQTVAGPRGLGLAGLATILRGLERSRGRDSERSKVALSEVPVWRSIPGPSKGCLFIAP